MIDFNQVSKRFGAQDVLSAVSFRINPGERVGVVGPNGSGKSTVFALISGEDAPDEGDVVTPGNIRIGHLHQQLRAHAQEGSLHEYVCRALPELPGIMQEIGRIEHALAVSGADDDRAASLRRLGELQHRIEHLGAYDLPSRAEAALSGLGFAETDFSRPFQSFSGGWQMRAELARTMLSRPDILLLDEPSNYLDLPAVEWLQRFLRGFEGTMLLISHDRYLLEQLTNRTLEISGGSARKISGGYAHYVRERALQRERQLAAHRAYEERKQRLEAFINRFRAQATKAAQVQSRVKMLEKLDAVPPPPAPTDLSRLRIPAPPHGGAHALTLRDVGFTYDGQRWIVRNVDLDIRRGEKIALVGFNGIGKTTLLRLMAGTLAPQEGERREGHALVLGYQSQDFAETLPPDATLLSIVRAANPSVAEREARSLLGSFGFGGDAAHKPSGVLSGGEKIRLAFARICARPPNLLLLDEPTTNLDIHGREALERAVREYRGAVCFVSHDTAFVRGVAEHIIEIGPAGVIRHAGGYDDYLARQGATTPDAGGARVTSSGTPRGREHRIARARGREAQRRLRGLEVQMEKLHAEQRELCAVLSGGGEVDHAEVSIRLAKITRALSSAEQTWLEEAEQVENSGAG